MRILDLEIVGCLGIGNSVLCNHLYCVIIGKLYYFVTLLLKILR
jgi:hypothetical protein